MIKDQRDIHQDEPSWQAGYRAGVSGQSRAPPEGVDKVSWLSGLIEGKAEHMRNRVAAKAKKATAKWHKKR